MSNIKNKAIQYFENEIKEINTLLKGNVSDRYKEYLNDKKTNYELAIIALSELEDVIEDM